MKGFVLTYHSHHVVGEDYARNDHAALSADLEHVTRLGCRMVSLHALVEALCGAERETIDGPTLVALTFDDGPVYDVEPFVHPEFGPQRGFLGIMRDFLERGGRATQPDLSATSFVIASPEARAVIESTYDATYTYVGRGAMSDAWWNGAIDDGLIAIGNHSWDHLHPALPKVAHSRQARADFTQVLTDEDADAQIAAAGELIARRTHFRNAPFFAYPFGQSNSFLADDYLPRNAARLKLEAAFTDEPRPVARGANRWRLPRYICGHHWKSPAELAAILAS